MSEKLFKEETDLYRRFLEKCHKTLLTNYFLADLDALVYPESKVRLDEIIKAWQGASQINFYTHIPFCYRKCDFCCFSSYIPSNEKEINLYVKDLIKYYDFFSPIFKDKSFTNLYFGGGTPSILKEKEMKDLLTSLFDLFKFDDDGQKVMEFNPATSSKGKLKLLKDFGFNKVSFGVQTFNQETLRLNNRGYQTPEMVKEAVSDAKDLGFEIVNIDLLFGLYGDTSKDLIENVKRSLDLNPDTIHLYSLQPTSHYFKKKKIKSKESFFERKRGIIQRSIDRIISLVKEKDYMLPPIIDFADLDFPDPHAFVFSKPKVHDRKKEYSFGDINASEDILGMGYRSRSHIKKKMRYSMDDKISVDPSDYIFSASPYTEKREMISFLLRNFSYQRFVSLNHFEKIFGKDLIQEFGEAIDKLKRLNAISIKDDKLMLLSKDLQEVLIHCLFLFDKEDIQKAIAPKEAKKTKMIKIDKAKSKMLSEKMEKIVKKDKYIQLLVTDGVVDEKREESFVVLTKEKDKKEIFVDDQTIVVNVTVQGKEFILTPVNQIKFDVIKKGDSLSVLSTDWNKPKALIVKREL
ncbi:MAG: radical SAM protein [Minisyncoccales bacterium]|jgi:coproporphyrinogen III oxidase-like Fe-S oxidoreductase